MLSRRAGTLVLISTLALGSPRLARADNDISYDYADYREPGGRIDVRTQSALAEQDLTATLHFKLGGVIDTIAGATPSGERAPPGSDQVELSEINDVRKAWNTELSDQFSNVNVSAGFARSLEHDYVSNGWSVNTLTDFNTKNTTLLAGAAGTDDNVEVFFLPEWLRKRTNDVIVGVTQLLDPLTSVSLDVTWSRALGMLDEPYKLVQKDIQVVPGVFLPESFAENRPGERDKAIALLSLNRAFPGAHGALEASCRFYRDTFGIGAQTLEAAWFQHLGAKFILRPDLRLYEQDAANFYYYNLDDTAIVPTRIPNPQGAAYSSDARLSAFRSVGGGLKAIWTAADWLQFNVAVEGYRQRGTDGITPQSAYYRATITSAGLKVSW